jgi:glutamyl-tRNA synthetase
MNELVKSFNIKSIGKSSAKFDFEKLIWINSQHIQKMPSENLAKKLSSTRKNGLKISTELVDLIKSRLDRLGNVEEEYGYLFEQQKIEPTLEKKLINDESLSFLQKYIKSLEKSFGNTVELKASLNECSTIGFGKSMGATRLCLVGKLAGPDLFELMVYLGKEEVLKRLRSMLT